MFVYVLTQGEQGIGGHIVGVFGSRGRAERFAVSEACISSFGPWSEEARTPNAIRWSAGSDWMEAERYRVRFEG